VEILKTQWDFFLQHIRICKCLLTFIFFPSVSWFEELQDQQLFEGLS